MSNETSREGFEKAFKKTEYYQSQKQLRLVEGNWTETYVEGIVESHYQVWQARDDEVNGLRKENKRLAQIAEGIEEFKKMSNSAAERDSKQITGLRKEVERLKADNSTMIYRAIADCRTSFHEGGAPWLCHVDALEEWALKAAKEDKQ